MDKQEASKEISDILDQIEKLLNNAKNIANENNITFDLDIAGYGMGGYYDGEEGEWQASSQSC